MPPSPICDDSSFLRRISLDIGGRLPTDEETKAFLASKEPDKRDRAIEAFDGAELKGRSLVVNVATERGR